MEILRDINTWIWNDYFWLPSNMTWNDISDTTVVNYAQFSDLRNGFKVAFALLVVRYIFEKATYLQHFMSITAVLVHFFAFYRPVLNFWKYVFSPIGQYPGLKPNVARKGESDITENRVLEKAFIKSRKIDHKQIQGLAKQLDWSERRVERWIRRRLRKATTLKKFIETSWKFTCYSCVLCYGLYTLWDKPWLLSTNYCWYDYPRHSVTDDIRWLYMLELGFHWSLAISQFTDPKRKDYLEMIVHHIVTITLLTFSWTSNFFRIGSLVAVTHNIAIPFLYASKMSKYGGHPRVADACFLVFTATWIISRLAIYPYRIIYSVMFEGPLFISTSPAYYLCVSLLCILQILHIIWTCMIAKIAMRSISSKTHPKDVRSDSEECLSSSSSDNESCALNTSSQINNDSG